VQHSQGTRVDKSKQTKTVDDKPRICLLSKLELNTYNLVKLPQIIETQSKAKNTTKSAIVSLKLLLCIC